jgi:hypothetical protein
MSYEIFGIACAAIIGFFSMVDVLTVLLPSGCFGLVGRNVQRECPVFGHRQRVTF